jgi:hypothetical protein
MNPAKEIIKSTPAMMRGLILFLFAAILNSCSSGLYSIYDFDFPMTNKIAKSNSSFIEVKIPQGWFVAEDNEYNATDLWLVKDDYSATIKFVMVSINDDDSQKSLLTQLDRIAELNKLPVKKKLGKSFKDFSEEVIENGTQKFLAFQYIDQKNQPVRTIVFKLGVKYFEVTAYALASSNPPDVFKAQNSVLASLK